MGEFSGGVDDLAVVAVAVGFKFRSRPAVLGGGGDSDGCEKEFEQRGS